MPKPLPGQLTFEGFDVEAAKEAKRDGMERAEAGADEAWKAAMEVAIVETAKEKRRFTSDDVYLTFIRMNPDQPGTRDQRALGPLMLSAARSGVCCKANVAPIASERTSLHASSRQVWRSLILDPMTPVPFSEPVKAETNAYYDKEGNFLNSGCPVCGSLASSRSVGYFPKQGKLGMWYCEKHWPGRIEE